MTAHPLRKGYDAPSSAVATDLEPLAVHKTPTAREISKITITSETRI